MIAGISPDTLMSSLTAGKDPQKLKQACAEFESLFLNYLLKSMRASVPEGGLIDQTEESKMFKAMLDEKMADEISASGGLGLGEILYRKLKEQNSS